MLFYLYHSANVHKSKQPRDILFYLYKRVPKTNVSRDPLNSYSICTNRATSNVVSDKAEYFYSICTKPLPKVRK